MSSHVVGFKPPDDTFKKMKAAYDACRAAGVDPPPAVEKFFGGEPPDDSGVEVRLETHPCCKQLDKEMISGFEVDLTKLPADVKIIRFYNSY